MNQHIISRIAIFLLSIVMIIFGFHHFTNADDLVVKVPYFLPGGKFWVYLVGVAFILAAVSFMTNTLVKVAAYLLAILLFCFVAFIHIPNYLDTADRELRSQTMMHLLKDSAIAAFALYIASNARHQKVLEETSLEDDTES